MSDAPFALDRSYRRPAGGPVVVAGSPLRLFRLTAGGVRVAEAIEQGRPLPRGHERLTDRLADAGAIHPVRPQTPIDAARLTVVVPARGEWPRFRPARCRTIVVDDASPVPLVPPADAGPVEVVRLEVNLGPGGARDAGLGLVDTELVAFVDTDVAVGEDDLLALATHLDDPRVGLVAPRVLADPSPPSARPGALQAFEQSRSPLDLGAEPGRVAPGTRVSYVPAATIVCRADAVRDIGGFDASLRYGEDVDLVWRLAAAGWRCRYDPSLAVHHRTRADLAGWVAQRFHYGTSAAALATRHPGALAPVQMSGWSAATWAAAGLGHPVVAAGIAGATASALARRLTDLPRAETLRLVLTGHLWAGRLLARTMRRAWWPAVAVLAVASRRVRRVAVAALAVTIVADRPRAGALDPVRAAGLAVLDDASYGAGVWAGAWRARSLDAIAPRFTSWPGRAR